VSVYDISIRTIAKPSQNKHREMKKMNGKRQAEWRRNQVFELSSKGHNQTEISKILQISVSTISRDISFLRDQAKANVRKYINETLPEEYEKCLVGLTAILREAWNTATNAADKREKIQALALAKECYSMKLDLLTNATVIDDAVRFAERGMEKLKLSSSNASIAKENNQDANPHNDNDELIDKDEEKREMMTTRTTNQVF
jgi:hypothetical protein